MMKLIMILIRWKCGTEKEINTLASLDIKDKQSKVGEAN